MGVKAPPKMVLLEGLPMGPRSPPESSHLLLLENWKLGDCRRVSPLGATEAVPCPWVSQGTQACSPRSGKKFQQTGCQAVVETFFSNPTRWKKVSQLQFTCRHREGAPFLLKKSCFLLLKSGFVFRSYVL